MKKLYVNVERLESRVALTEDNVLTEYEVERNEDVRLVGSIFKGKITNLENSLQASFIDIGYSKNAFLHYWDMLPSKEPVTGDTVNNLKTTPNLLSKIKNKIVGKDAEDEDLKQELDLIPQKFPVGSDILVQVTKGPIGTKGPRVSTHLSLPGRFLVLLPYTNHIGVSKRISNNKEKERLRKILHGMNLPEGMGVICRTLGEGQKQEFFEKDIAMLLDSFTQIEEQFKSKKAPFCLYQEPSLLKRSARYFLTDDVNEINVDNKEAYDVIKKQLSKYSPKNMAKIKYYNQAKPIFEHFCLGKQVSSIFKRQVSLKSGGYLCIDETEALIAIDINSGKARQGKDHPETILNTNVEAAIEIARQLRLRDIGGLVVIDFIDMRQKKDQNTVYKTLKSALQKDRAKTKVSPISQLGLLEMTRQREHASLQDSLFSNCMYCKGKGIIKSELTISVEIMRKLQALLRRDSSKDLEVRVIVHPRILNRLKKEDAKLLTEMENALGGKLSFRADSHRHIEDFVLMNPTTQVPYKI